MCVLLPLLHGVLKEMILTVMVTNVFISINAVRR
jgi:hypothetical protein